MATTSAPAPSPVPAPCTGFVGLGNIGFPMAVALTRAGLPPRVHDLDAARVRAAEREGMTAAGGLAGLAGCDVVAVAVPDDQAAEAVVAGGYQRPGLAAVLRPGALIVLHSTLLPATAHRLAEAAGARGLDVVDAPVSGGAERAARGDLTVMAGGSDDALRRAAPCLDAVASETVHVGPTGAGSVAKLANQLMMFSALAGAYEAFDLAEAHGVDAAAVRRAVRTGTGDSWVAREWGFFERVLDDYRRSGVPAHERSWSKDLWDVVATAREAGLALPWAGLLAQTMATRVEGRGAGEPPERPEG